MTQESINMTRIKLLALCFGISGLGVLINLAFLINVFLFVPEMIFYLCVWTISVLATTGTAQIIANEIWLFPIISWLESRKSGKADDQERKVIPVIKLTFFLIIFWLVCLTIGYIILRFFAPISLRQVLIIFGVGFGAGALFLISWLLVQRWQAKKLALSKTEPVSELAVANAFLKFPLRSAGISLLLWFYAGVALYLGYYYVVGFTMFESAYILIIACSSGVLAFPFQYFLFKRALQELLQAFLTEHPFVLEQKGFFSDQPPV